LRGTPQLYSGDEIGMTGGADPDNRHDFPGGFGGDAKNALTKAGRSATEEDVFAWTSSLLALRKAHPSLQTGLEQNLFSDEDSFAFVRTLEDAGCSSDHSPDPLKERFLIVVNKAQHRKQLDLPMEETGLGGCTEFQTASPGTGTAPVVSSGKLHLAEPPESIIQYEVR